MCRLRLCGCAVLLVWFSQFGVHDALFLVTVSEIPSGGGRPWVGTPVVVGGLGWWVRKYDNRTPYLLPPTPSHRPPPCVIIINLGLGTASEDEYARGII